MRHIIALLLIINYSPQTTAQNEPYLNSEVVLTGSILNQDNTPISYATIIIQSTGKGTISNENGEFSIDTYSLNDTNTIRFQCIGYKTKKHTITELKTNPTVVLNEDIYKLDEVLILGNTTDVKKIVKSILQKKNANYKMNTKKQQIFLRERSTTNILKLKLDYKKHKDFAEISPEMLQLLEEKTPKHTQSYSDILTDIYIKENELKCLPIKIVTLEEENPTELKVFEKTFRDLAKDTEDDEFWRIKTGIFGSKIPPPPSEEDSLSTDSANTISIKSCKWKINESLSFSTFEDKEKWEFLYKVNKYNFEIIGGTTIKNEKVYIIDFTPKENGLYKGRLYVAMESSALIRADYTFAPKKTGKKIQFLGVGFENTNFSGSIYFEKKDAAYELKYLSFQNDQKFSLARNFSLLKKKKRILLNKKLKQIKFGVNILAENHESIELLIIDNLKIPDIEFKNIQEEKNTDVTYVNQFNKELWRNYITIEPTQQMKEYTKNKN